MDDFGEVSGIRLTVPHVPCDLQDLTRFFVLLDGIYEDCVKLTILDRVPTEVDSDHQQKLLGSLDDLSGAPRPRVRRIEGGSMILELLRDSSFAQAGAALAALAAALKGVEKVSTTPARIRRRTAEENRKRAEENAKAAEAETRQAEAEAKTAKARAESAEARAREAATHRNFGEVAARASEDTLTALTVSVARLHELTGGESQVEELPEDDKPPKKKRSPRKEK
ncbi:hypothetical protein ACVB8X_42060 [Streptomyces sp. NRAIS4]